VNRAVNIAGPPSTGHMNPNAYQQPNNLPIKGQLLVRISEIIDFSAALAESESNDKKKAKKDAKKKKGVGMFYCSRCNLISSHALYVGP
jgi:hypothetical protein